MIGTGKWAPWDLLPAMGNLGKVRGAPCCPTATVHAVLLIAHLRGGSWGPKGFSPSLEAIIHSVNNWASKDLHTERG
eukprot:1149970-Heterocapsa_arctica.AAC.1